MKNQSIKKAAPCPLCPECDHYHYKDSPCIFEHTPLPWKVVTEKGGGFSIKNGKIRVCWMDFWGEQIEAGNMKTEVQIKANARFIVTACNNHEALVGALGAVMRCNDYAQHGPISAEFSAVLTKCAIVWDKINPAVAKAKVQQ